MAFAISTPTAFSPTAVMIRHATTMQAEGNYVDSHGQSEIGFGLTRLLGYDLLPRIKQINKVKLYRPGREDEDNYERRVG
ncbi:Tn3 family transposase [Streptomyces sp. V1I1]|uniref:Tn3 family transposase n=1 Tax=Streptomyces sp. V1I1 TaxID=3042272 RepID=UPI00277F73AF|nr:TnpA family transposase [Streptomyces sp. V1I1]